MVHDYVIMILYYIMLCYVICYMLQYHDITTHHAVYSNIITICSFVINIFLFYFGGLKQAGQIQTTTPLMNGESVWYQRSLFQKN